MIGLNSRDMTPAQQQRPMSDKFQTPAQILHLIYSLPTLPRVVVKSHKVLTRQAGKFAHHADQHEQLINKVTYFLGVLAFGSFCYLLGARPQEIPHLYCAFFIFVVPLRWVYYRIKKWHYYLLDFCYYANAIFVTILLFFPNNEKLYMLCFSFSEGPLAWALIVWRCSLVFNSIDKTISVLIHLLPGTVFFILRWWDPINLTHQNPEGGRGWPMVESALTRWTWLFAVPLLVYVVWQGLYFLVVEGVRRQRISRDPEIKTSYRELKRKAERAKNVWWRLSGLLGDEKRVVMYAVLQAAFTVATLALTVPMFTSYRMHIGFEVFKLAATVWNGGNFIFDVMPRMQAAKCRREAAWEPAAARRSSWDEVEDRMQVEKRSQGGAVSPTASPAVGVPLLQRTASSCTSHLRSMQDWGGRGPLTCVGG